MGLLIEKARATMKQYPDSSFSYAKQALNLSETDEYQEGEANVHEFLGEVFFHQAAFEQSLTHYFLAQTYYENNQQKNKLAECKHKIGLVYYYTKQPNLALTSQKTAQKIFL